MDLCYVSIPETGQRFYIKGSNPSLLIVSGTHGDEYEVVPFVEEMVTCYHHRLPDFLYVPEVSPSALALKEHDNQEGFNVNRSFFEGTKCKEAQAMMDLWSNFQFELFITFHEDPTNEEFFIYDGVKAEYFNQFYLENTKALELLRKDVTAIGVRLYNGIDDLEDPDLGYIVNNGIAYWPMEHNDYSSDYWLLVETGLAKHVINPEVPGLLKPVDKKREIVRAIFRRLLLYEMD